MTARKGGRKWLPAKRETRHGRREATTARGPVILEVC